MTDLADLKRRVEEATGPDRELDARLWQFFNPTHRVLLDHGSVGGRSGPKRQPEWGVLRDFDLDGWPSHFMAEVAAHAGAPLLTASLDATVALIERVLPGVRVGVDIDPLGCDAVIMPKQSPVVLVQGLKSGPLALLSALLAAMGETK